MTILVAGATGLVGGHLVARLLEGGQSVVAVGRRPTGIVHPALGECVAEFDRLPPLPPARAAVSALGTTMAAAGSRAAFAAVDRDAVLAFARAARAAGCRQFVCITAVGASSRSPIFYNRIKGEVEDGLQALGFDRLDLVRPGLILGPRASRRPMEALAQAVAPAMDRLLLGPFARYRSIPAETIAAAIASMLADPAGGLHIHENQQLRAAS